jgi:hypothetical protein
MSEYRITTNGTTYRLQHRLDEDDDWAFMYGPTFATLDEARTARDQHVSRDRDDDEWKPVE